jgi:hypothetical protein
VGLWLHKVTLGQVFSESTLVPLTVPISLLCHPGLVQWAICSLITKGHTYLGLGIKGNNKVKVKGDVLLLNQLSTTPRRGM